ncbi:uncharacterized protein LOC118183972 isoform X3 [Stegodyphus dumicola]|uniref:uncharacterized protein LOC118183972 isoform X3 n=1 Tax=Stegodyphus dumicola TaxID=202533 RepID=UPI0015B27F42|nr:uncharacterized protein LOC118183972 isoform X3 [Stegodyphus dumicola]
MYTNHQRKMLADAICSCNSEHVRAILDEDTSTKNTWDENLLHLACKCNESKLIEEVPNNSGCTNKCLDIIYMLIDFGLDTEERDENGNTCLFYAVQNENLALCDLLLQCGADMWANTELGVSVYDYVMEESASKQLKEIFMKFYPGLWKAVEHEDIYQVRKLINLWCRTNLHKNGVSLKDIALQTGNEEIISLILGVFESMNLVYHILAKNIKAVTKMLETCRKKIRLDLRKMSDRGAPILYYLIQSKDVSAVELFIKYGCQIYTIMQDSQGYDMPVLFSALMIDTPPDIIEALLPKGKPQLEDMLCKILYRGKTVLEVALEQNVSIQIFNILIDRSGPLLLSERNQFNQTIKDLAILNNQKQYVEAINQSVFNWIYNPSKYPGWREQLALFGWEFEVDMFQKFHDREQYDEGFLSKLIAFQMQIEHFAEAVELGDVKKFIELKDIALEFDLYGKKLLWHARVVGYGMPLLHSAVLHNHKKIVEIILSEKPIKESIDNLFDQNHRTALHYAYARATAKEIKNMLLSYGCSEHVLDKKNKEPLDFKDKQDNPIMMKLLNRLKTKAFDTQEPDPWKINSSLLVKQISCCQQPEMHTEENVEYDSAFDFDEEELSEYSADEAEEKRTFCIIS